MSLLVIPHAYAGLNYPEDIVNFTYNASFDSYNAQGSGENTDLNLTIGTVSYLYYDDTITVYPIITVTDGTVNPTFTIGWDPDYLTFDRPYEGINNDSTYISSSETYTSEGNINKTWYFSNMYDPGTLLSEGDRASYFLDFKWQGNENSMYYWNNEVEDMYGDDWTFTSGWAEGSTPYILGEVASQDAIWLLGDNLSSILYKNGESKKNKQLIGGEREKMKPLDYPVKVYNADGELVLETTESYLREHRKEIELTYNLISDKKVEQRLTDQQKQELYKHLQEINEKDLK